MRSPFPGMDPYIESCGLWEDFHDDLIAEIKRALARDLPPGYLARTRKRSYLVLAESEEKVRQQFIPDVSVTVPRSNRGVAKGSEKAAPNSESGVLSLRAFIETEFEEQFLDIYELKPERRLVTSIEILSPSNKVRRSPGWKKYLRKRQGLLLGKANLVEIDLLRGGDRMPMLDPWPESPYTLLVARDSEAPRCRVWPAYFHQPLPTIPVPLRAPDADIPLALQPLVESIYERSRYGEEIDYRRPPEPPFRPAEAAWVEQPLPGRPSRRGKRRS